jgi:hypothetical protein
MAMTWASTRKKQADPALTTYQWRQQRKVYARQLPMPCARCGRMITTPQRYIPGTKTINRRSLVVGHKLARSTARALGYSEQQIRAPENLQPECWECSSKSGARMGAVLGRRAQQAALAKSQPASKIKVEIRQAAASSRW